MIRVAVCGGIGSGKSTVCDIFASHGVAIYNSDQRAKALMNESEPLRKHIIEAFGEESYEDGELNRHYLASQVFGDKEQLAKLNAIVHPAVIEDFVAWAAEQEGDYCIVESAILFESGLNEAVDKVVAVLAPHPLRVERAMQRDGATKDQGADERRRTDAQSRLCDSEYPPRRCREGYCRVGISFQDDGE